MHPSLALPRARIPRAWSGELERPRLLARLEAAQTPLVTVLAPAGYGKSTLLAQYARSQDSQAQGAVVWLELEEDHADPILLTQHLLEGLLERVSKLPALGALREQFAPSPLHLARALSGASQSLTLCLDGVEVLGESSGRWLGQFALALEEGHRLLLAGRSLPPSFPLARAQASGQLTLLETADLAFDASEVAALLEGWPLAYTECEALEGWAAGLSLLRARGASRLGAQDLLLEGIEGLPQALRDALPELAPLEVWSEVEVARLGWTLPTHWLECVRAAGLPITPLGAGQYRPHRLLREMLEERLKARPERYAALYLEVARSLESEGRLLEALEGFRKAGAKHPVLRLAAQLSRTYRVRRENHLLRRVLEPLESELTPELCLDLAHALMSSGEALRGERLLCGLLEHPEYRVQAQHGLGKLWGHQGQHAAALEALDAALKWDSDPLTRWRIEQTRANSLLGLGRLREALTLLEHLSSELPAELDAREHAFLHTELSRAHYFVGQHRESEAALLEALYLLERGGVAPDTRVLNDLCSLYAYSGRLNEAWTTLERAKTVAERDGHLTLPMLCEMEGYLHLLARAFPQALESMNRALRLSLEYGFRFIRLRVQLIRAELLERLGRPEAARAALLEVQQADPCPAEIRDSLPFYVGLLAYRSGDWAEAEAHWATVSGEADPLEQVRAALYRAELSRRRGTLEPGLLERAFAPLETLGSDVLLNIDREDLRPLYEAALERGLFPGRIRALLEREAAPQPPPPTQPPTLRLFTLGTLRLKLEGVRLRKLPLKKSGEILVWLALFGAASKERIMADVWAGSLEARHGDYFRVAVRRLRHALSEALSEHLGEAYNGFNPLPFEDGQYRLSEHLHLELDTWVCRAALTCGEDAALETALEVGTPEFLSGLEGEWIEEMRLELRQDALRVGLSWAAALECNQTRKALGVYGRLLALEPGFKAALKGIERCQTGLAGVNKPPAKVER